MCSGKPAKSIVSGDADPVQGCVTSYMASGVRGAVFSPPLLSADEIPPRPRLGPQFEMNVGKLGRCQLRLPRQ